MKIISFYDSGEKEHWLGGLRRCEWAAGRLLCKFITEDIFFEKLGEGSRLLLLTQGDELVSFCTYAMKDDIPSTELSPWMGFVYTFPRYRGRRLMGLLFEEVDRLARSEGFSKVYISTDHVGLYEKYGCEYMTSLVNIDGDTSRVYVRTV